MEFRQLKYFIEVAELLHFRKASENLFISQSALSQQIHLLEEEIGIPLFDPNKRVKERKVELTEAGKIFLEDAKLLVIQRDKALGNLKRFVNNETELHIGFFKLALREWTVELLNQIANKLPKITVKILEFDSTEGVHDGLISNKIDLGITLLPLNDEELDSKLFGRDNLDLIMSSNHPLANKEVVLLEELKNEKWVTISKRLHPFYDFLEHICQKAGFSREAHIVQETSSHEMLCGYVSLGIGVAFMPSLLFELSKEKELVAKKILRTNDPNSTIEVLQAIAWRKEKVSPRIKSVLELIPDIQNRRNNVSDSFSK